MFEYAPLVGMLIVFAYLLVLDLRAAREPGRFGRSFLRWVAGAGRAARDAERRSCGEEQEGVSGLVEPFDEAIARARRKPAGPIPPDGAEPTEIAGQ